MAQKNVIILCAVLNLVLVRCLQNLPAPRQQMTPALRFRVIHERNFKLSSLINMLDRINRIDRFFVVLLSFPDGRTKTQCRQRRQEKAPGQTRDGYYGTPWKMQNPVSSLPRSGILLSQFLLETEKKKRKSSRSSKSCHIKKTINN